MDCADWSRLTTDAIRSIAGRMHPNHVATGLKLVDRATAASLCDSDYRIVHLQAIQPFWALRPRLEVAAKSCWPGPAFAHLWGRPEPWRSLTLPRRLRLLCLAASSHHAASLDVALAHSGVGLRAEVVEAAAAAGGLQAVQRLVEEGCECSLEAVRLAAACGHLHILRWIWSGADLQLQLRRAFGWVGSHDAVAEAACAGGRGAVLSWLAAGLPEAEAEPETVGDQQPMAELPEAAGCAGPAAGGEHGGPSPQVGPAVSPPHAAPAAAPAGPLVGAASGELEAEAKAAAAGQPQEPAAALPEVAAGAAAPPADAFAPRGKALLHLMNVAACHGHPPVLEHLPQQHVKYRELLGSPDTAFGMLKAAALSTSEHTLARLCTGGTVVRGVLAGLTLPQRADLLASALCSLRCSWQAKADWLLAAWQDGGPDAALLRRCAFYVFTLRLIDSNRLVGAQPDVLARFRFAATRADLADGWHVHAATVAVQTGSVGLLEAVLADWRTTDGTAGEPYHLLVHRAVLSGDPYLVELLAEHHLSLYASIANPEPPFNPTHLLLAAEKGNVRLLEEMYQWFPVTTDQEQGGSRAAVEWRRRFWARVFRHAAEHGASLQLLQHLHYERGVPVDVEAVAAGGSVESVEWAVWAKLQQELDTLYGAHQRGTLQPGFSLSASTFATAGLAWRVAATWGNIATAARLLHYGTVSSRHVRALQSPTSFFDRPRSKRIFRGDDGRARAANCLRLWASLVEAEAAAAGPDGAAGSGSRPRAGGGGGSSSSTRTSTSSSGGGREFTLVPTVSVTAWADLVSYLEHGARLPEASRRTAQLQSHQLAWTRIKLRGAGGGH